MRKALVTGVAGQDGTYLAEFLLESGYEVHGTDNDAVGLAEAEALIKAGSHSETTIPSPGRFQQSSLNRTMLFVGSGQTRSTILPRRPEWTTHSSNRWPQHRVW